MGHNFPLYDHLNKTYTNTIVDKDKLFFIDTLKMLDSNEHELLYALIRTHQVLTEPKTFYQLPYQGKHQKNSIKFDFDQLPIQLQHIILEFVQMNINR